MAEAATGGATGIGGLAQVGTGGIESELNIHCAGRDTTHYFRYSTACSNRVENWASGGTHSLLNHLPIDPDAKVMPSGVFAEQC